MDGKKWYNNIFVIIIAIILFWPLGLILLALHPKMKKAGLKVSYMVGIIIFVLFFVALFSPSRTIESISIEIANPQAAYDLNTDIPINISVTPEDADTDALKYYAEGDSMTFSGSVVHTGSEEGTFRIAVKAGDIKSNVITIPVIDVDARREKRLAAEEAKAEQERLAKEQAAAQEEQHIAEETKQEEEKLVAEEQNEQDTTENQPPEEQTSQSTTIQESSSASDAPVSSTQNNSSASGDGDNFNTYDNAEQQQTTETYVLNTSSLKIHHPSCKDVKKIAPQNYSTSSLSLDELQSQGYSTCGHCFK